ncbi:MAG: hypothetical protein QXO40_05755 [Candidatus Aenigmatarchaeota archaeon]
MPETEKEFEDSATLFKFLKEIVGKNGIEVESVNDNGNIVDLIGVIHGRLLYTKNYSDEQNVFYLRDVELW